MNNSSPYVQVQDADTLLTVMRAENDRILREACLKFIPDWAINPDLSTKDLYNQAVRLGFKP